MPIVSLRPLGESGLFHMHVLEGAAVDPGYGQGRPGGVDPGYGRPTWPNRPDQSLPGYGHPDAGLPGYGHPGGKPPGTGGIPDNSLPDTKPPTLLPGYTLVLVRGSDSKWHYAAIMPGSAPPKPLPEPPKPDTGPVNPDTPPAPDQTLPTIPPA